DELHRVNGNSWIEPLDIDDSLPGDLIDAAGAHALGAKLEIGQAALGAVLPGDEKRFVRRQPLDRDGRRTIGGDWFGGKHDPLSRFGNSKPSKASLLYRSLGRRWL